MRVLSRGGRGGGSSFFVVIVDSVAAIGRAIVMFVRLFGGVGGRRDGGRVGCCGRKRYEFR